MHPGSFVYMVYIKSAFDFYLLQLTQIQKSVGVASVSRGEVNQRQDSGTVLLIYLSKDVGY